MTTIAYYKITHRPTGQFYIGSSQNVNRRIDRHRRELTQGIHINKNLQRVYTCWDDFSIDVFQTNTLEEARAGEQRLLDQYIGSNACCNVSTSSINGLAGVRADIPREVRIKNLEKATEARRGNPLSDAHKARLSESHTGKRLSAQHRAALAVAKSGRVLDDAHKRAISAGNKGKTRSDEYKKLVGELKSKQVSINGIAYPSLKAAATAVGLSDVTVRKRLNDPVNYTDWFYID